MSRVHPNSDNAPSIPIRATPHLPSPTAPPENTSTRHAAATRSNGADTAGGTAMPPSPLFPDPGNHGTSPDDKTFDKLDSALGARSPTVNRRAWRLLGQAALLARAMNPREDVIDIYHDPKKGSSRFMIHPNSKFRRVWEVLTACCVLYVCVVVPLVIGFNYVEWGNRYVLDTIVDVYFVVDMFVTMRTGIFSNGEVIMDSRAVMTKYLHTWFLIDIMSNFPLALFVESSARKSIKMVKLQKLPKLLRIGRLLKYLREYAKYYNLALSFVAIVMALHLLACLWASLFNTCSDADGRPVCESEEMPRMYVQSMHTIVLMFLGISENSSYSSISHLIDPSREATTELYIVSNIVFVLGTVFTAFFFGNILALIMSWDQLSAQFRNRMDIIAAEMRYYELPEELQHRVRRNYDYLWINQRAYSDMMLLHQPGISKTLRMTIALHLYKDLVKTVPFFAGSDVRFLGKVCLALETAVYLPGDTIIYYDDIGKEMFIVRKGLVEIFVPDPDAARTESSGAAEKRIYLRDGNFFGETALVIDVRRTNTVKAVNICDLNVLSKTSFNEIVAEYPEFGERMKRTVIKRQLDNMNIQSPVEKMKIQNQLNLVVEKSLKARRMSVSLRTIYRAKKLGDKLKEIADRAAKSNSNPVRRLSHQLSRIGSSGRTIGLTGVRPISHSHNLDRDRTVDVSFAAKQTSESGGGIHGDGSDGSSTRGLGNTHMFPVHAAPLPPVTQALHHPLRRELLHQGSSTAMSRRANQSQIDAVSRKLSKAELTMDLIPAALLEITSMVNQIKRTTERLNRKLNQNPGISSDDEDDDDDDDNDGNGDDSDRDDLNGGVGHPPRVGSGGGGGGGGGVTLGGESETFGLPLITPLSEEFEDEMARRETQSIYIPKDRSGSTMQSVTNG